MKLKNKRTGEIKECVVIPIDESGYPNEYQVFEKGDSLAELNEEWEDAPEEPKKYWYASDYGYIYTTTDAGDGWDKYRKEVGNYFETRTEAEKAVKRLKAWKRLKDKGLKIHLRSLGGYSCLEANWGVLEEGDYLDVRLLFGGEK